MVIRARSTLVAATRPALFVRRADAAELGAHTARLAAVDKASKGHVIWAADDNEIPATAV